MSVKIAVIILKFRIVFDISTKFLTGSPAYFTVFTVLVNFPLWLLFSVLKMRVCARKICKIRLKI